jgi:hypothetical protein
MPSSSVPIPAAFASPCGSPQLNGNSHSIRQPAPLQSCQHLKWCECESWHIFFLVVGERQKPDSDPTNWKTALDAALAAVIKELDKRAKRARLFKN